MEQLTDTHHAPCATRAELQRAAAAGPDALVRLVAERTARAAGGRMDAAAFARLSAQQLTLWAYDILRGEMMEGGCVQLIHNGWADLFFRNPFARAVRGWGLADLAALVNRMRRLWLRHGDELERPCTDEEFMALYERFPAFDALDDCFVEREEEFTLGVARYVEAHAADFVTIAD